MTESDTNSNTYFESTEQQPAQTTFVDENDDNDDNENEIDIDIDAHHDVAIADENLFGELDDDDDNNANVNDTQSQPTPGNDLDQNDTGTVMDVEELFGSDPDDDAHHDDRDKQEEEEEATKELDREYKRSVPEGKKQSISSSLNMRALPTNDEYEFCVIRLPNVVGCEAEPFEEQTYVEPTAAHNIDNFIRWRTFHDKATDETYKESNTRLVVWEDGTKSLVVGKDVYDIEETALPGDRDYIYAKLPESTSNASHTSYHACHSKVNTKMSVRTTTTKSYAKLQKNLTKKYERTKGSKQLMFGSKRSAANYDTHEHLRQRRNARTMSQRTRRNQKQKMDESFLTQGAHGNDSDDDDDDVMDEDYTVGGNKKKTKRAESGSSNESDDDDDDDDDESDSEEDNVPIAQRL
mmetsp:Transcript_60106/g.99247  ORF Transcript_60106/g.99247 Transcript_60106/m.99247 type:complete len:408 (-) Transcript_60106:87-1310(-)